MKSLIKSPFSKIHYGWIVIFTALMANIGSHGFSRMAYTLVLPEMMEGLNLSYTQAGLLGTGNFAGYLISAVIGGLLASRYGSRIVISFSMLLIGISMILTGMAQTFETALLLRFLTGLGNGGVFVPALSLGSAWFDSKRRGFAMGIVAGGAGMGIMLSGIIVPKILFAYNAQGWSYAWFYMGIIVLAICGLCFLLLRNNPEEMGLQPVGSTTCSISAEPLSEVTPPMKWDQVYKIKEIRYLGIVYFVNGFTYVIYMTFFKAFLTAEVGLTEMQAAAMWTLAGSISIFSAAMWGSISDRLGRKHALALVFLNFALSFLIFALFNSLLPLYISVVFFGTSLGAIPTIMGASAGDYVGPRLAPAAFGFITLFFAFGQVLGPAFGGYLTDLTGSFRPSLMAAAAVALAGAFGSLLLKKPAAKSETG